MKVIDLLNKIANGEKPKFRYRGQLYHSDYNGYYGYEIENGGFVLFDCVYLDELNDEIEIIEDTPKVQVEMTQEEYFKYLDSKLDTPKGERNINVCGTLFTKSEYEELAKSQEEKKIEKLDHLIGYDIRQFEDLREYVEITTNDLFGKTNKIIDKINEIIDKLNGEDNGIR